MKKSESSNQFNALRAIKRKKVDRNGNGGFSVQKLEPSKQVTEEPARDDRSPRLRPAKSYRRSAPSFVASADRVSVGSGMSLVAMMAGESFHFLGSASICPVVGSVSVMGQTFSASPALSAAVTRKDDKRRGFVPSPGDLRFWPMYSPRSSSLLSVTALAAPGKWTRKAGQIVISMNEEGMEDVVKELRALAANLCKDADVVFAIKPLKPGARDVEKMQPIFKDLFTPHQNEGLPKLDARSVVCVVGSKGVGKSTFSRYLTNSLLSRHPRVAFLDCDLGQPEFTPSGVVSLHVIDKPLVGPSFTHLVKPHRSLYVGATTPKGDPDWYVACLETLYDHYVSELQGEDVPLVINTDGWVKAMGYDLLVHVVRHITPSHVAQLNFAPSVTASQSKNIALDGVTAVGTVDVVSISAIEDTFARSSKFNNTDLRSLSALFHFARRRDAPCPLDPTLGAEPTGAMWDFGGIGPQRVPFRVPFAHVRVHFMNMEVPLSQTLFALNGSVVGLVRDTRRYEGADVHAEPPTALRVIPPTVPLQPRTLNCIGLGLIRGIDPAAGLLYINTSVPLSDLEDVNLLIRGAGSEVPVAMLMEGLGNVAKKVPYMSYIGADVVGSAARRTRFDLKRRRGLAAET